MICLIALALFLNKLNGSKDSNHGAKPHVSTQLHTNQHMELPYSELDYWVIFVRIDQLRLCKIRGGELFWPYQEMAEAVVPISRPSPPSITNVALMEATVASCMLANPWTPSEQVSPHKGL